MAYTPKDPAFADRVLHSFQRQAFMEYIGAQLVTIEPGFCEIHVPYRPELTQQHGFFHAGIVGTIADNTAGYAAYSLMEKDSSILTVEFKLNLLSTAAGDLLIGKSSVLKYGKTLTVCRSDIYIVKGDKHKLCAASQSTLIELKETPDN